MHGPLGSTGNRGGGVTLHGCGVCGGVFLARACADRFATSLPLEAIALADAIRASGWGGAAVAGAAVAGAGATVATDAAATDAVTRHSTGQVTAETATDVGIEVGIETVAAGIDAADVLGGVFDVLTGLLD